MLETIKELSDKHIVLAGNFDFFFNTYLNSYRGKLTLKKITITKFIELKEKFHLCDIWRRTLKLNISYLTKKCFWFNSKTP